MEGLITKKDKPSNTEVLGLLLDEDKLKFISNLNNENIKGLCKLAYLTERLENPNKNPIQIHTEILESYLALKCSLVSKEGNRADQIVDALKHIIEEENKDNLSNLVQDIKS